MVAGNDCIHISFYSYVQELVVCGVFRNGGETLAGRFPAPKAQTPARWCPERQFSRFAFASCLHLTGCRILRYPPALPFSLKTEPKAVEAFAPTASFFYPVVQNVSSHAPLIPDFKT